MKTSLDHLPEPKQHEIRWAAEIILEMSSPEMLILFGSYARGDWVEERAPDGYHFQYQSDFDILAVVRHEAEAGKINRNDALHSRLHRTIKTPISLISEDIQLINRRLDKAHYFFADIQREGIVLYDSGKLELAQARELTAVERRNLAQEDFEYWFTKAEDLFELYHFCIGRQKNNQAAFQLHQITERLFVTLLLVYTRYKPRTHDLEKLKKLVAGVEPHTLVVFPTGTLQEQERFELLRKAYVDSRYNRTYAITPDELQWLAERVEHLMTLTKSLCEAKIRSFVA